jgi:3-oxoadipate enol-lactonase
MTTPGLLFIHAFPVDARMWEGQAGGSRTVTPDLPGFGGSPAAEEGVMTMGRGARRCLDTLDQAGLGSAVVCGLSMGGYVAFELWRLAPDRVAGLVLANTRAGADTAEGAAARRALADRLRSEGNVLVDSPPPLLSEDPPAGLWDTVKGWIADQPVEAIAAASLGMAERPDSTPDLAAIDVPTLVITSEGDTLIPAEVSAPVAEQIPGARLAVLPKAGHLSNVEDPDGFSALLSEHLERCGAER